MSIWPLHSVISVMDLVMQWDLLGHGQNRVQWWSHDLTKGGTILEVQKNIILKP